MLIHLVADPDGNLWKECSHRARMAVRHSFLTPLSQVTDRIGHSLPEALSGVENAGPHRLMGNTTDAESRQPESPSQV